MLRLSLKQSSALQAAVTRVVANASASSATPLMQTVKRHACGCQYPFLLGHQHHHHQQQQQQQQQSGGHQHHHREPTTAPQHFYNSSAGPHRADYAGNKQLQFDYGFEMTGNKINFGNGVIHELGQAMKLELEYAGAKGNRVMLLTDKNVLRFAPTMDAIASLKAAGLDVVVYSDVEVEPTDISFMNASKFAAEGKFDGFVSVGGGSVMDTAKAANLFSTYPHPEGLMAYVNKPIGLALAPPGLLKPHIACPTTSGTGAECTGFAVFDLLKMNSKTGLGHKHLIPNRAIIDPAFLDTLPAAVVAASGFDVLSHALESYTARPYSRRPLLPGTTPLTMSRPIHQGSNPYSDFGCLEALKLCGRYLTRAVNHPDDKEARTQMLFAATLAGVSMGNAGTQLPHGLSYPVSGFGIHGKYHPGPNSGYPPKAPIIPHGFSVMMHAPSSFALIAEKQPERVFECANVLASAMGTSLAGILGADNVNQKYGGVVVHSLLVGIMKATKVCPSGLEAVGIKTSDVPALVERALPQKRVLDNAPFTVTAGDVETIYKNSFKYW